jgi:hypothetical protein
VSNGNANEHRYEVLVDDNFHYMDEEYRYKLGEFRDCQGAIAACKKIVDEFLLANYRPGMASGELWQQYSFFGEDPFISTTDGNCRFSAWSYARERCKAICHNTR